MRIATWRRKTRTGFLLALGMLALACHPNGFVTPEVDQLSLVGGVAVQVQLPGKPDPGSLRVTLDGADVTGSLLRSHRIVEGVLAVPAAGPHQLEVFALLGGDDFGASRSFETFFSRSSASTRSDFVIRPDGPLPFTCSRSNPSSLAMRRATGVARTPSASGSCVSSSCRCCSTSVVRIAPAGPLPSSSARSTFFSPASRRARGVASSLPSGGAKGASTCGPGTAGGSACS